MLHLFIVKKNLPGSFQLSTRYFFGKTMGKVIKLRVTKKDMEQICNQIAEGQSLTKICKAAALPSYRTVLRHVQENDDAHTMYRKARALQSEVMRDQILDLVNLPLPSDPKLAMAEVQRRRLQADHMDKHIRQMQPLGVRDKAEDKANDQVGQVTLSWQNGSVEIG